MEPRALEAVAPVRGRAFGGRPLEVPPGEPRQVYLAAGAADEARRVLKPEIPSTGVHDIPIRDELELELPRSAWQTFVERYRWPQS